VQQPHKIRLAAQMSGIFMRFSHKNAEFVSLRDPALQQVFNLQQRRIL